MPVYSQGKIVDMNELFAELETLHKKFPDAVHSIELHPSGMVAFCVKLSIKPGEDNPEG